MALMLMTKKPVLEICFGKKTKESVVGTFKNICTIVVHCSYIKDIFADAFESFSEWLISLELK